MNNLVSFIIPAFNEGRFIEGVIASIHCYSTYLDAYEIIVVDNGSNDGTDLIAQNRGAIVYRKPGLSLGALRNFGALKARYDHLVFLDADVHLTPMWRERILQVLDNLTEKTYVITGSTYGIRDNPNTIEFCWWGGGISKKKVKYINSGHMILHRQVFKQLGGFNESLKTGEDWEFCQRPREITVKIMHDAALKVIHEGYPKTWYQFFRRERWHGLGDYNNLSSFIRSKPALISTMQAALAIVTVILAIANGNLFWLIVYPTVLFPICILAAWRRSSGISVCLAINTGLYITYFWARAMSLLDHITKRKYMRAR